MLHLENRNETFCIFENQTNKNTYKEIRLLNFSQLKINNEKKYFHNMFLKMHGSILEFSIYSSIDTRPIYIYPQHTSMHIFMNYLGLNF